ncbi:MAG: PAS domain S-box protein [Solirubrobacteraceae bacterium]
MVSDISTHQHTEQHLRALLDSAPDATVIVSERGEIEFVNALAVAMFGYAREDLIGQSIEVLVPERRRGAHPGLRAKYLADPRTRPMGTGAELYARRKDGSEFAVEVTLSRVASETGVLVSSAIRDITERKRAEQATARLAAIVESCADAIFMLSPEGVILTWNAAAERLYGYTAEDAIDQPREMLLATGTARKRRLALVSATNSVEGRERRRDGSVFDVAVTTSPVKSVTGAIVGISCVVRDITERKRAEQALGRLAAIVDSSDDAIIGKTLEGQITSWNAAAQRIYGYSAEEAIGQHFSILLSAGGEHEAGEILARVRAGEPVSHSEVVRRRRDGQVIDVSMTVSPIRDESGQVVGTSTVTRDITGHKRAERERVELLQASIRAESANRAKSEFLARMSHELRTPLNSIIGFTQLVELDGLTPLQSEHTRYVLSAAEHLLELITEVLQLARIEAGQVTISPEPVSLSEAVAESLALVAPQARDHGVTLSANTAGLSGGGYVRADRQRLKQVLLNVLSNAVKYNRPGGRIDVSFAILEGERVRTTITDTGIGIASEQLARLFAPFERLGAEFSEVEGTGLGLALSKGFVEAMGGRIEMTSRHGIGTSVSIELAGATQATVEGRGEARERDLSGLGPKDGGGCAILCIEDNLANLTLVEHILGRYRQIKLIPAMQGTLGLELVRTHQIDLIVLDLHLPDMPGTEVLKRLKAEPATREIPVVVLTADASPHQAQRIKELGAAEYLTKPLDVPMFLETVARYLDGAGGSEHGDG